MRNFEKLYIETVNNAHDTLKSIDEVFEKKLHWILPKKVKYTKRDVDVVLLQSFMYKGKTVSLNDAKMIVRATADYHVAKCSSYVLEK